MGLTSFAHRYPVTLSRLLYSAVVGSMARPLLELLFGEPFAGAGPVILLMLTVPVIKAFVHPASIALMALGKTSVNFGSRVAATAVTLTLGTLMIRKIGLLGGAGGIVISFAVFAAGMWVHLLWRWRAAVR